MLMTYPGGAHLKSCLTKVSLVFLSHSGKMPAYYDNLGHDHNTSHHFHFTSMYSCGVIWCELLTVVLNKSQINTYSMIFLQVNKLICGLVNDAVSISDYITSNDRIIN
jgi:hypothetical protein